MKILDHGTKLDRPPKFPYLDNPNVTVSWNAEERVLELVAQDNPSRYKDNPNYKPRHFHCRVQLTLDELTEIINCAGNQIMTQSAGELRLALLPCVRSLLRMSLVSSGLVSP